jgi:uncharacterized protein
MVVSRLSTTPIKGLGLFHPPSVALTQAGAAGDRRFLLIDEDDQLVSIRHTGAFVRAFAEYDEARGRLTITADGDHWEDDVLLGEPVTVTFYASRSVRCRVVGGGWNELLSARAGRSLRLAKVEDETGGGDAHPVTLLGEASVEELARQSGIASIDPRRFRMLIQFTGGDPHVEDTWAGRVLRIGGAVLRVGGPVPRCAATTRDPMRGNRNLQTVNMIKAYRGMQESEFGQGVNFGVYADVLEVGKVNVGDRLELDSQSGEPHGNRPTTIHSECDASPAKTNADGARG